MSKRAFDVTITLLAALAWVPLALILALVILITEGRPIFYVSSRRVDQTTTMRVWKLRTMVRNADKIANRDTVPVEGVAFLNIDSNSPLYTRVGRLIERFDLTELPQLVHVLRGQMSLVGSRPLPERVIQELKQTNPNVEDRFRTKAGVAGPTQLVGRSNLTDKDRLDLEGRYSRIAATSYSPLLDLSILVNIGLVLLRIKKSYSYPEVVAFLNKFDAHASSDPMQPRVVEDVPPAKSGSPRWSARARRRAS